MTQYTHIRSRALVAALPFAAAACVALGAACSQTVSASSGGSKADPTTVNASEIIHEDCDVQSKNAVKTDARGSNKPDIVRVMKGSKELCRAIDFDSNGRFESFIYFDDQGLIRRRESDFDGDGRWDEVALYKNGKLARKQRETNLDGKLDTWDTFENDVLVLRERDDNADGKIDQWWRFPNPARLDCPIIDVDNDGDGKPDARQDVCKEREAAADAGDLPATPASTATATPSATQASPPTSASAPPPPPAPAPAAPDAGTKSANAAKDGGGAR